jgi:hypothetical protein
MGWYEGIETPVFVAAGGSDTYGASQAVSTTFGAAPGANAESVEVKLMHRFRVKFGTFRAVGHHVKTITKPNVTFAEVEVPKLNSKVYFAGRKTQDQATVELDDSLDNAVTSAAQAQLQRQANFDTNSHAKSGASYFYNIMAEEVNGEGTALSTWYYNKCVVMTCDFGTLDYTDDAGTSSVNMGIRYANFTTWILPTSPTAAGPIDSNTNPPMAQGGDTV